MSIRSEITRISTNIKNTLDVVKGAGISVSTTANSNDLPTLVSALANGDIDCGLFTDAASTTGNIDNGTF